MILTMKIARDFQNLANGLSDFDAETRFGTIGRLFVEKAGEAVWRIDHYANINPLLLDFLKEQLLFSRYISFLSRHRMQST